MKERPILFQGAMVRALLDGSKTQTRRIVKSQPPEDQSVMTGPYHPTRIDRHGEEYPGDEVFGSFTLEGGWALPCPYGQPGDRLWVREAHHRTITGSPWLIGYEVPGENREFEVPGIGRVREFRHHLSGWGGRSSRNFPSIHMPRWACRILLEIVSVRVERLNDISNEDALAEGVKASPGGMWPAAPGQAGTTPRAGYALLWESINGAGSWSANPFVWAVEVKRVTP